MKRRKMAEIKNYLPEQYEQTGRLKINHNYLPMQFADNEAIWRKIRKVVVEGDFTLGRAVNRLEGEYAVLVGAKHGIAVGSGTDALFLSLKSLGIGHGDEVITTPYTFYATIGAIVTAGATPVFIDVKDDYNLDPALIEEKITRRTKAIMPVHWAGKPCDMDAIEAIAHKHGLFIVCDACHAVKASYKGKGVGGLGTLACYSFHPLKNLNVWGDGGIITTNDNALADKLRLLRNHGLVDRDTCQVFAYNSRLDTIQAVVALHLLDKLDHITQARIANAAYFDEKLQDIPEITIPRREKDIKQGYHLYMICCSKRDELQAYLIEHGVDAKVHYPTPMHLQPAAEYLGHQRGDFPKAEAIAVSALSLPVHEFITREQQDYVIDVIRRFYGQ